MSEEVAVIGGGISGVQAALDLAKAGVLVHLIERGPSLGGHMAQLDKTFPTNDCSACILSPKLVEAHRHPLIRVWTLTEAVDLQGSPPDLTLRVRVKPRFVREDRCVGCGECANKCPSSVKSEFELGLCRRKAIYIPFAQAVPLKYTIDPEHCLKINENKCGNCQKTCPADAVDFGMEEREEKLEVGAVIVSTGFDQFDPEKISPYHYGENPNVMTALEFERILSPSGPTGGHLVTNDGSTPRRLVFVQCVGSRDRNYCEHCSRFCCMASLKQAMIALEHEPSIEEVTVCYMDLRSYGKDFDRYRDHVMGKGIRLIRGRPSEVNLDPLGVRIEDVEGASIKDIEADMVVLAMAAIPSRGTGELADALNIELDDGGFIKTMASSDGPLATSRRGVFAAGCCTGPKDIPDSVCEASAAASLSLTLLPNRKPKTLKKPKVRDVSGEIPRTGVFVCRCGTNIASTIDVPAVVEAALKLEGVAYAEENLFTCSEAALDEMATRIRDEGINRVVIAACTPRTHEPIFKDTLEKAGINPYLLEMANIRDQCSWVHQGQPIEATRKAIDLVKSAVAKANQLEPLQTQTAEIIREAVVVGGGPAGLSAARDMSKQGFRVHLIESQNELGGRMDEIHTSSEFGIDRISATSLLEGLDVDISRNIKIESISGSVGDFNIVLNDGREIKAGAIILAPGADLPDCSDKEDRTITSLELDRMLREGTPLPKSVAFVQCVGVRNERFGCSRFCCKKMLEQAKTLVSMGMTVSVLHKDIMAFQKEGEALYRDVSEKGVRFYRIDGEPDISSENISFQSVTDGNITIPVEMVIESIGMIPSESNRDLSLQLKVPLSREGFFLEKHPKLAPVEFAVDGIFMAGCAQYPKDLFESMVQGSAAAAKAAGLLSMKVITTPGQICVVDEERCRGCGECESLCSYGAARLREISGKQVSHIEEKMCKGCGLCAVSCPSNAIEARGFTIEQIDAQIDALLGAER
ncbi:MAG: CoB--CoM heterodisulfide reductase iron-sulfur subunit A family protein [Methanomassiliicoccales archaeon]|nr:CoB--CoM heterodisulfide reductase iron-sulfur subunit A family protein [Methanomassiliicoccales archaeon]